MGRICPWVTGEGDGAYARIRSERLVETKGRRGLEGRERQREGLEKQEVRKKSEIKTSKEAEFSNLSLSLYRFFINIY